MSSEDQDIEQFKASVYKRSLQYHWHLREIGHDVKDKIIELEADVYTQTDEGRDKRLLWQRDIDELQLLLCITDGTSSDKNTKAVVYKLGYTKLVVNKEDNHWLPHFHIEYKNKQYRASYRIDDLQLLVGTMPKRYEKAILEWASRHKKSLQLTWDALQAGEIVGDLILHADESS